LRFACRIVFVGIRPRLDVEVLDRPAQNSQRHERSEPYSPGNRRRTGHDKPECGSYLLAFASIRGVRPAHGSGLDLQIDRVLIDTGSDRGANDINSPAVRRDFAGAEGAGWPAFYPGLQWRPLSAEVLLANPTESGRILGERRTVAIKSQFSRLSPHGVTT
jgi:hypothetical protein